MASDLPTLGYWNVRGYGEPIRLILHYAGIKFNDIRYTFGLTPENFWVNWLKEKHTLGLEFPNLPYWIEGDLKLTQSTAILRHVARKANLMGENEIEQAQLDMLEQQAIDLRWELIALCIKKSDDYDQTRPEFVKSLSDKFKPWSDYLGEKTYLAGDRITYVDFLLADILSIYDTFESSELAEFTNLTSYLQRIEKLPTVAKYLNNGVYSKIPYMGPYACWGHYAN